MQSREGVTLTRTSKVSCQILDGALADWETTFEVEIPELGLTKRSIKFPRQIIRPPYKKEKPTSVRLFTRMQD
jgi:hypothetical protein